MYAHDDNGNRESITYPNEVKTTYTYDVLSRLIKQVSEKGATTLSSYTYVLSPNGQRQSMTEHTGRKSAYVYDKLNRLTAESISDVLNGNRVTAYTYDKVGNRQQQVVDGTTTAYTYNANDWIQSAGTVKYTYDANGNTLTETDGANVTTYVYDKRNKLVKATTPSDTVTYQYAPNGLRTQQVVGGVTTLPHIDAKPCWHTSQPLAGGLALFCSWLLPSLTSDCVPSNKKGDILTLVKRGHYHFGLTYR